MIVNRSSFSTARPPGVVVIRKRGGGLGTADSKTFKLFGAIVAPAGEGHQMAVAA